MIIVSIIAFISCLCIRQSTEQDYAIARGNAITSSYNQGRDISDQSNEVKALDTKRNACMFGMIASGITFFISLFVYPATKRKEEKNKKV